MSCRFMWGWRAMVPLCVHLVHLVAVVYREPRLGRFYSILFYSIPSQFSCYLQHSKSTAQFRCGHFQDLGRARSQIPCLKTHQV